MLIAFVLSWHLIGLDSYILMMGQVIPLVHVIVLVSIYYLLLKVKDTICVNVLIFS